MRRLALALLIALPAWGSDFTDAESAASTLDFARAKVLFRAAMTSDSKQRQRDVAAVRLANIEWRIDHDADAAIRDLAHVADGSEQATDAWIERARIAAELKRDYAAAAADAEHAVKVAQTEATRSLALQAHVRAIVDPVLRARIEGRCEGDAARLDAAKREMAESVASIGARPGPARLLLDAALLTSDGATALSAWRGYYGITAQSSVLAPAAATLDATLPQGTDHRAIAKALGDSRLFPEAALVWNDGCGRTRMPDDLGIVAYEAKLHALGERVDEYYRQVALHHDNAGALRKLVDDPNFRGFGAYINLGKTGGVFDLHYGHVVLDETREVSQYGYSAPLHFIQLDGIVSNGFWSWVHDGHGSDGGWANTAIYQVRPVYAGGAYGRWLALTDPKTRAEKDREIETESLRDTERLAKDPDLVPLGVALRLARQYDEQVKRDTSGRDTFAAREDRDVFESSIWAHEGRHAIDKKRAGIPKNSSQLEFDAKLSEVVFAPAPREAIVSIMGGMPKGTSHGDANRRIGALLRSWMTEHAGEITGLDRTRPVLLQVDKLTDDQMRAAMRSMDPLAR